MAHVSSARNRNDVLFLMQKIQDMHCAIWTECVWQIASAEKTDTKFIISDHPVTVYNADCFPLSKWCKGFFDPDIRFKGTHTIFPLSIDRVLIFTNLSWVRNPYTNGMRMRPNPSLFRGSIFNFTDIQTERYLDADEVNEINFITKKRAYRYIAAAREEWLYPEKRIPSDHWRKLGKGYLLMPDPRSVRFGRELVIGYSGGRSDAFDEYGRKPWQKDFKDDSLAEEEWNTSKAFQGEYARTFGPKRRGRSFQVHKLDNKEDSPDYHQYHLDLEKKYKRYKKNG